MNLVICEKDYFKVISNKYLANNDLKQQYTTSSLSCLYAWLKTLIIYLWI